MTTTTESLLVGARVKVHVDSFARVLGEGRVVHVAFTAYNDGAFVEERLAILVQMDADNRLRKCSHHQLEVLDS
jgi:hypothetical protein